MTTDPAAAYAVEIREWLLGRLAKQRDTGSIELTPSDPLHGRARLWWILEGKRYAWLDNTLARSWPLIEEHANHLLATYNPVWRVVDSPEGETDWLASAFASLTAARAQFVSRAARPGLDDQEKSALLAWLGWARGRWEEYIDRVGPPEEETPGPTTRRPDVIGEDARRIRRCAHIARRSRWPLLRNVVAESLRAAVEPQELDRLPLPTDHATLFELVCMVRIMRALAPGSRHVRWIDLDSGRNQATGPGFTYTYQRSLSRDEVLGTGEFDGGLREAMLRHVVRTPQRIDGLLEFDEPLRGFHGILVEAKAGSQSFDAAVYQLKCYRAALKSVAPGPLLVWGIVERSGETEIQEEAISALPAGPPASGTDLWIFSSADRIPNVLQQTLLTQAENDPSFLAS